MRLQGGWWQAGLGVGTRCAQSILSYTLPSPAQSPAPVPFWGSGSQASAGSDLGSASAFGSTSHLSVPAFRSLGF